MAYRASFMVPLKVYRFFDVIRPDPRFADLLRRAGHAGQVGQNPAHRREASSASRSKEIAQ